MSAIIAGKSCKRCGNPFYVSLGHPDWYDDVIKRGLPATERYDNFCILRQSGMCLDCFAETMEELKREETPHE